MSFQEQNQAKLSNWKFIEMWVDPTSDLPYILMLVGDADGSYKVYDPTEGYKVVYSEQDYQKVKDFLLEDECVQIQGRYYDYDYDPEEINSNIREGVELISQYASQYANKENDISIAPNLKRK
jgi:hypothetical protein